MIAARNPKRTKGSWNVVSHVVGADPARVRGRVGAQHVVVHQDVLVTQLLRGDRIRAHDGGVGTDLRLGEHHTDLHPATIGGQACQMRMAPSPCPEASVCPSGE